MRLLLLIVLLLIVGTLCGLHLLTPRANVTFQEQTFDR